MDRFHAFCFALLLISSMAAWGSESQAPFQVHWRGQFWPLGAVDSSRVGLINEAGEVRYPSDARLSIVRTDSAFLQMGVPLLDYSIKLNRKAQDGFSSGHRTYRISFVFAQEEMTEAVPFHHLPAWHWGMELEEIRKKLLIIGWWNPEKKAWYPKVWRLSLSSMMNQFELEWDESPLTGYPVVFLFGDEGLVRPAVYLDDAANSLMLKLLGGEAPPDTLPGIRDDRGLDANGIHWIQWAASLNRDDWLSTLAPGSVDRRSRGVLDPNPVLLASSQGNVDALNGLLKLGYMAETQDALGFDAGLLAVYAGHLEVIEVLLENGYSARRSSRDGIFGATLLALDSGYDTIFSLLVERGGSVPRISRTAWTEALAHHAQLGNLEIVRFILERNARVNSIVKDRSILEYGVWGKNTAVVELLIESGADLKSPHASDALNMAIVLGHSDIVALLLDHGVNLNTGGFNEKMLPLATAIISGNRDIVQLLLDKGADPSRATEDKDGIGTVEMATLIGSRLIVEDLFQAGAICKLPPPMASVVLESSFRHDIPEMAILALEACLNPEFRFYGEYSLGWVADYFQATSIQEWLKGMEWKDRSAPDNLISGTGFDEPPVLTAASFMSYSEDFYNRFGNIEFELMILVDEQGIPRFPKIVSDSFPSELVLHALPHIEGWRFNPAKKDGKPVKVVVRIPLDLTYEPPFADALEMDQLTTPPKDVFQSRVHYPPAMSAQGITGEVWLRFVVTNQGDVTNVEVLYSTHPLLSYSAVESIRKWKFEPGKVGDRAVNTRVLRRFPFRLR